jgi:ABC-type transport system involved in multi-copper enzyme maturation permease subunit
MISSISAELMILRRRAATWILLGLWAALAAFFAYILPYADYRGMTGGAKQQALNDLLPSAFVGSVLGGYPFFGGVLILILGVLALGSDYGWGTLKTLFTQRPGRLQVFGAKLIALGITLVGFVLASFATSAVASALIASRENAPMDWPGLSLLLKGMGAAWLIMAVWCALGVMLAVISQGTALAIGIGILYGLVIEGLISALLDTVDSLQRVIEVLLRANGYSLIAAVGASVADARENGPGSFSGPYVSGTQALLVLCLQLAVFVGVAAALLRQRDVT